MAPLILHSSMPSCVSTATIRLRHPVSHVRIPSRVLSIPIPIPTPTPILLRHSPFRIAPSMSPSPNPIGPQRKVSGPDGEDSRRGAEGYWEGRCSYIGAAFIIRPGLQKADLPKTLPKKVGISALTLPTPIAKSKTPPRPLRPLREAPQIRVRKRLPFRTTPCYNRRPL